MEQIQDVVNEFLGIVVEYIHDVVDEFLGKAHAAMMNRGANLVEVDRLLHDPGA